jgi:hypothetical protein
LGDVLSSTSAASEAVADQVKKPTKKKVRNMDRAHSTRRYEAGDAVKLEIVLHHRANLREVRVLFENSHDESAAPLVGQPKGAPPFRKGSGPGKCGLLQTGPVRREPDNRRENAKTASPLSRATIRRRLPAVQGGQQAATGRCASEATAER